MYQSKCENILFEMDSLGIAAVTLNRPEFLNAFTGEMMKEMADIMDYCSAASDVRAVVVSGVGKHFCAGGDVARFKRILESGTGLPPDNVILAGKMAQSIRRCGKPVIAKVKGAAVGAGSAIAMACDFRVLATKSKLGSGFINVGFSGDTCSWYFWSRLIGMAGAAEFFMMNSFLTAQQAMEKGLVTRVVEEDQLDRAVQELATTLAESATVAIAYQKNMLYLLAYFDMPKLIELEHFYMTKSSLTTDHREAITAFFEKRPPHFIGT